MAVIELSAISKHYEMGQQLIKAVDNLNLTIDYNEYVVFIGSSGSGKSTLMNIIGCLDTPTSGRYVLNERDVNGLDENELADIRNQEIVSGLTAGDEVVTGPDRVLRALRDGDRIAVADRARSDRRTASAAE